VDWPQTIFGAVLVALLLGVAGWYGWRQVRTLRRGGDLQGDEQRFQRGLAHRRLAGSLLMLVLAGILTGVLVYLEGPTQRLADERDALNRIGDTTPMTPEQKALARAYGLWWIAFLLILLALVGLALIDVVVIRRFARQQRDKLRRDRRAMIERQVARLRQERDVPPDISVN
jgi:hypothetical protein